MLNPRDRRRLVVSAIIAAAVILAATLYFVVFRSSSSHPKHGIASDSYQKIAVDGVELAAEVLTPRNVAKPPLIVIPGSFGTQGSAKTLHQVSAHFARLGYEVVAYGQRGFGGSTGKVDFAGPATQRDARAVITWSLQHTHANPNRVAMLGMSYGAGISLLTAAHDPRVRAVAALSTWTNFADSYLDVGTPHTLPLKTVLGGPSKSSMYDPTLKHLQNVMLNHPTDLGAALHQMSHVRSPDSYIKQLNKNNPAIMIANGFQDSYFNPSQLISFMDRLKTPKRLELAPGDHGGPERGSLTGLPNEVIDDAQAWFGHYLRGADNGINKEEPIVVRDSRTGELTPLRNWPDLTRKDRVLLDKPGVDTGATPTNTWISTITTGKDSGADAGPIQLVAASSYKPATIKLNTIPQTAAFTWTSPTLANGLNLLGTPSLTINLAATSRTVTLFLYLYDVAPDGTGTLIDQQPYTTSGLSSQAVSRTIPMQPMAWNLPAGDRLSLIIDTVDPRYTSLTPPNTKITVTSNKKDPASFSSPAVV
jgi:predicted acyl esterase